MFIYLFKMYYIVEFNIAIYFYINLEKNEGYK